MHDDRHRVQFQPQRGGDRRIVNFLDAADFDEMVARAERP